MTDNRREDSAGSERPDPNRLPSIERDQDQRDDLTRRRELAREAQLTNRERETRWPIG
jgi:hypothetical protein